MEIQNITHDLRKFKTNMIKKDNKFQKVIIVPEKIKHAILCEVDCIPNVPQRKPSHCLDFSEIPKRRVDYIFSDEFSTVGKNIKYCSWFTKYKSADVKLKKCNLDQAVFYIEFANLTYGFYIDNKDDDVFVWSIEEEFLYNIDMGTRGYVVNHDNDTSTFYSLETLEIIKFVSPKKNGNAYNFELLPNGEVYIEHCERVELEDDFKYVDKIYYLDRSMIKISNFYLCMKNTEKVNDTEKPPKFIKYLIYRELYKN